jgi:hypothetical protein
MTEAKGNSYQNLINIEYHSSIVTCEINKYNRQIILCIRNKFGEAMQAQKC